MADTKVINIERTAVNTVRVVHSRILRSLTDAGVEAIHEVARTYEGAPTTDYFETGNLEFEFPTTAMTEAFIVAITIWDSELTAAGA